MTSRCDLCPCSNHCVETQFCGTLSLIFQRIPEAPIRLGEPVSVGSRFLGTVVGMRLLENGNLFVKLRVDDSDKQRDRFQALAMKYGLPPDLNVRTIARVMKALVYSGNTGGLGK
jgi:hypothetical protein